MKLGCGRYQASTQVKVLSPEIIIVSEADSVHLLEGNTLKSVIGEDMRARRGLRPIA
jgi:hypothetical protein